MMRPMMRPKKHAALPSPMYLVLRAKARGAAGRAGLLPVQLGALGGQQVSAGAPEDDEQHHEACSAGSSSAAGTHKLKAGLRIAAAHALALKELSSTMSGSGCGAGASCAGASWMPASILLLRTQPELLSRGSQSDGSVSPQEPSRISCPMDSAAECCS